jgi:hypothetical protein
MIYEIYLSKKEDDVVRVTADLVDFSINSVIFKRDDKPIAVFNFNNIDGFMMIERRCEL